MVDFLLLFPRCRRRISLPFLRADYFFFVFFFRQTRGIIRWDRRLFAREAPFALTILRFSFSFPDCGNILSLHALTLPSFHIVLTPPTSTGPMLEASIVSFLREAIRSSSAMLPMPFSHTRVTCKGCYDDAPHASRPTYFFPCHKSCFLFFLVVVRDRVLQ